MDYSKYEVCDFDHVSAFNMSTGYKERSYQAHWHSYGEILPVGPGRTNISSFNRVFREEKGMAPGEYRTLFVGKNNDASV